MGKRGIIMQEKLAKGWGLKQNNRTYINVPIPQKRKSTPGNIRCSAKMAAQIITLSRADQLTLEYQVIRILNYLMQDRSLVLSPSPQDRPPARLQLDQGPGLQRASLQLPANKGHGLTFK